MAGEPKRISVIIPTYNRVETLALCLNALGDQTIDPGGFEVIVVDDGSVDSTREFLDRRVDSYSFDLVPVFQASRGPSAARNKGLARAGASLALFLGDDILSTPSLLEEHLAAHASLADPHVAILGHVTWDPALRVTPFMHWLENGGPQFRYWDMSPGETRSFYTCNVSVKKDFLVNHGTFDEDFPYAAYEDIELARRLFCFGLRIIYRPSARAFHHHTVSLDRYVARMALAGRSAAIFDRKHQDAGLGDRFRETLAATPRRSLTWSWLHELTFRIRIPWLTQRIAWRSMERYQRLMMTAALEGYAEEQAGQGGGVTSK